MGDLTNPKVIKWKGVLFLVAGILASTLLLYDNPSLRDAALLIIAIWSFCRFYYFAFYVIEHYVDPGYRFAGLGDFLRYCWRQRRVETKPPLAEESLQHCRTFILPDAGGDLAGVVELGMLEDLQQAAARAILGGGTTEDDAFNPDVDQRSGAHRTGLFGHVQFAFRETPIAEHAFGLGDGEHLGMGRGVLEDFHLVAGAGDDAALVDDDRADGHFLLFPGAPGLPQGFAHEIGVAVKIDDFVHEAEKPVLGRQIGQT